MTDLKNPPAQALQSSFPPPLTADRFLPIADCSLLPAYCHCFLPTAHFLYGPCRRVGTYP